MKILDKFPYSVREVRNCWIPLSRPGHEGVRLAARLWLPDMPEGEKVPAVMDFFVYRKSDIQAVRDSTTYGNLAGHGYACVKVDCRGTGDSDGLAPDQFSTEFVEDALEALAWIARQPWCTGKVGMTGLSWPGHMCLQVAARNPPELRAIVPMDAADDRYTNKYHGGCLLHYGFTISTALLGMHARPPNPEHVGEGWRDAWKERVENSVACIERWTGHPDRDDYWAAGSVVERYKDMTAAVYASCGLADPGYAVCVPRMLKGLTGPRKVLLGPWAHRTPHYPAPGPGVDFVNEMRRWFDHWLKGIDTGMLDEPAVRAWIYDAEPPRMQVGDALGRWVTDSEWPPKDLETRQFTICAEGLVQGKGTAGTVEVASPLTVGAAGGEWMPWFVAGNGPEMAGDQRTDDALSACFDSPPLEAAIDVFGQVRVALDVSSDQREAQVALRLCAVAPDGTSRRLAFGFLDLSHREGDAQHLPVEPGKPYRIALDMLPACCHVPKGHRLRLAVSTSYWPMIWPSRFPVRLSIHAGQGALSVPIRPRRAEDDLVPSLGEPTVARGNPTTVLRQPSAKRSLTQDLSTGASTLTIEEDGGHTRIDDRAIEIDWTGKRITSIRPDDPLSASAYAEWTWKLKFGAIETVSYAHSRLTCTAGTFEIEARVEAREGGKVVAEKTIRRSVPRAPA